MKVLVVNTVRFGMNGITSVIMNYFRICRQENIHMDFLVNGYIENVYKQQLVKEKAGITVVDRKNIFLYIVTLIRLIKKNQYDVIHIHGNSATMAIEAFAAKICRVKIRIVHCHSTECTHKFIHKLLLPLLKRAYTKALACSEQAGTWIFGKGKFDVLNNGIFVEDFLFDENTRKKIRDKLSLQNKFVIGHIGLLNKSKNHEKLLQIVNEIKKIKPGVHLLCVSGSDSIPENIRKKIEELDLQENITILLKRRDVNKLVQAMDFFVFPSKWEGFGMAVIEAEAGGLPCLVSNAVPNSVDLTDCITHYSLKKDDIAWAKFICENATSDTVTRKRMNGLIKETAFNINNCKKLLFRIYRTGI